MRIFVDPTRLAAGTLVITGDEHHYLGRVRRARPGDRVELVDGAGRRAAAVILESPTPRPSSPSSLPRRSSPRLPTCAR